MVQLEQTSGSIKALISGITEVLDSAKLLIRAKKTLADTLDTCQFDCLGTTLTDDEILIASSLKQFAKFLSAMEDEMNGILLQAHEKFITPLLNFRRKNKLLEFWKNKPKPRRTRSIIWPEEMMKFN